jgi:hypothetical protein
MIHGFGMRHIIDVFETFVSPFFGMVLLPNKSLLCNMISPYKSFYIFHYTHFFLKGDLAKNSIQMRMLRYTFGECNNITIEVRWRCNQSNSRVHTGRVEFDL